MQPDKFCRLLQDYANASKAYQATSYWGSYEKRIIDTINSIDLTQLRSGKYPILATFGFGDDVYLYHANMSAPQKAVAKFIHRHIIANRAILPYGLNISNIQELAYHHCQLMGITTNSIPVGDMQVSTFGNPRGIFEADGNKYTVQFLAYYIRYCFANKHMRFKGDEVVVELGSGSGYQIEVLKKLYPNMTVLCFDMPAQIFLCEEYLTRAMADTEIVGSDATRGWTDLSGIKRGGIHFFGNWQFPLLDGFAFDIFWNAASFGEMEPDVVENYLKTIKEDARWVYLLQARHGKETHGKAHVAKPVTLKDYNTLLSGYVLQEEHDAWQAHRRLGESGGYFEGVWKRE